MRATACTEWPSGSLDGLPGEAARRWRKRQRHRRESRRHRPSEDENERGNPLQHLIAAICCLSRLKGTFQTDAPFVFVRRIDLHHLLCWASGEMAGASCPKLSVEHCSSRILASGGTSSLSTPPLITCCMSSHAEHAVIQNQAVLRLRDIYKARSYEEMYSAADAPVLAIIGRMCLSAMENHPQDMQLRQNSVSLMGMIGLGSLVVMAPTEDVHGFVETAAREESTSPLSQICGWVAGIFFLLLLASAHYILTVKGKLGAQALCRSGKASPPARQRGSRARKARQSPPLRAAEPLKRPQRSGSPQSVTAEPRPPPPAPPHQLPAERQSPPEQLPPEAPEVPATRSSEGYEEHTSEDASAGLVSGRDPSPPLLPPPRSPPLPPPLQAQGSSNVTVDPVDDENRLCVICLEAPRTHACVPCGHWCLCAAESCILAAHQQCPLCRAEVNVVMRMFGAPCE